MKKYLITGALALVACATLTSCHSDDDLSGSLVEQKLQAYEQVFEEEFGKVDPNQDWGFGTAEILSRTRTADPTANIWAASNGDKWAVPPELTATQKDIVRQYFQQNTPIGYKDPEWENYFVQQVYKGGTKAKGSGDDNSKTTEKYTSANGGLVTGSDHMDQLCAVYDDNRLPKEHIYNFNYGDYPNPYPNVLDYTKEQQYEKNDNEQHHHADQIMLMVNSTTENFGYFNSDGSLGHINYTGLVGWETIYNWAKNKGISGYEELKDGWNRSYMGFDFEQVVSYDIYAHTDEDVLDEKGQVVQVINKKGQKVNKKKLRYLTYGDFADADYIWDGSEGSTRPADDELVYYNNQPIPMLINETNEYCGLNGDIDGNDLITKHNVLMGYQLNGATGEYDIPYYQEQNCLDMTVVFGKISHEYLPVVSSAGTKWVKVQGGADGYYSDWIVTLTKAEHYGEPTSSTINIPIEPGSEGMKRKDILYKKVSLDNVGSGRVFCEDLGVVRASDIDFNDIVFDVLIYKTEYITYHQISTDNGETWEDDPDNPREVTETTYNGDVWLLAGGGTIPATITIEKANQNWPLKETFESGLPNKYIVNTIENEEGRYGNQYRNDIEPKKLNTTPLPITSAADVAISVQYGSSTSGFYTLTAYRGVAPHKICVPLGTKWLKEREEISNGYPHFTKYVKYQDKDGNYLEGYKDNPGTTYYNDPEEPGYVGDGDPKESDERNTTYKESEYDEHAKSVWEDYNEASLYKIEKSYTYTPRHEEEGWTDDEVFIKEVTSGGGATSGYQGEPVLIRVRH